MPRASAISGVTFAPGRTPPWPGLAPWLSLTSIIFTCSSLRRFFELYRVKAAIWAAAAEIAGAEFPNQVAAASLVISRHAAFAAIVKEAAFRGAAIERFNRMRAKRAEAHGGDIENAGRVRPRGSGRADQDPWIGVSSGCWAAMECEIHSCGGCLDVQMAAERFDGRDVLRPRIDHGAVFMIERPPFGLALDSIRPEKGPDVFRHAAQTPQ